MNKIEYEQQDIDRAWRVLDLGFLRDSEGQTMVGSPENIKDVARSYYQLRLRTYNPHTGTHY